MKKIITSLFVAVLALMSFQSNAAMYIIGYNGNWTPGQQEEMTETSDGVYAITHKITTNIYFCFIDSLATTWDQINGGHRYGSGQGKDVDLTLNVPSSVVKDMTGNGSYHFQGDGSNYTVTYNTHQGTVTVTTDGSGEPIVFPNTYYIMKDNGQSTWNLSTGEEMKANADSTIFSLENLEIAANGEEGYGYFTIAAKPASSDTDWDYFNMYRYAPDCEGDFTIDSSFIDIPEHYITIKVFGVNSGSFKIKAGNYNVTLTIGEDGNKTVVISNYKPAGVKGDVNNDGVVNSSDLAALVADILNNYTIAEAPTADVNGDNEVNASDVSALTTIILGM